MPEESGKPLRGQPETDGRSFGHHRDQTAGRAPMRMSALPKANVYASKISLGVFFDSKSKPVLPHVFRPELPEKVMPLAEKVR